MASTYVGFYCFPLDFLSGKHDFTTDVYHIMLTNTLPDYANDLTYNDIVEIDAENGYAAGGIAVTLDMNPDDADTLVTAITASFTAAGGSFGPFRWAVLFNYSSPAQELVAAWEYEGGSISVLDTEEVTMVFAGVNGVFRVSQT